MFELLIGDTSNITSPDASPADENGPNKSDAVFDADWVGDAAAPNSAVTREKFVWLPISDADTLVGAPFASPTHRAVGCVAAAPPKHQSR